MTRTGWILVPLLIILMFTTTLYGQQKGPASQIFVWKEAALIHLLTPDRTKALRIKLTPHFEIIDGTFPILLTGEGSLYDLQKNTYYPHTKPLSITSFTMNSGLCVVICNDMLGWYEDSGVKERIRLPHAGMKVASGPRQRIYVYGDKGTGSIIYLLEDGKEIPIIEISKGSITAFAAIGKRIFYAVDNSIYTVAKDEKPGLFFIASGEKQVRSLAIDTHAGIIYFSSGTTVYAARAGTAISIVKGIEGYLRYSGNALFILDPKAGRLVKITGLEKLTITGEKDGMPGGSSGEFKE
ncbi:MAG: hypothetical protein NTX75_11640 [Proteobacteria bacterium]|nr:hypothetical protein [Pseudomonadota bacterium]